MEFFARPPSDFCTFKSLCTIKTNANEKNKNGNTVDDARVTQTL